MWKHVRSLYDNHILIQSDIYVSRDDIISINNVTYEITGITDDSDIYLQDQNKNKYIYHASAFVQMLSHSTYIKNSHQECIERNKQLH